MPTLPRSGAAAALLVLAAACQKAQTAPLYEAIPVERRDIVVTASASGVIQPILTFSVKSKAWGEIIEMRVQTGDEVKKGQLLARIDPRIPRQNLTEAQARLDKARAQLQTATAQL
jgi:multidrug efflux pump subunit AcrA (membrane-fusion protein)